MMSESIHPEDAAFWEIVGDIEIEEPKPQVADDKKRPIPKEIEWGVPPTGYSGEGCDGDIPPESDI